MKLDPPVTRDSIAEAVDAVARDAALTHDLICHNRVDGLQSTQRIALDLHGNASR